MPILTVVNERLRHLFPRRVVVPGSEVSPCDPSHRVEVQRLVGDVVLEPEVLLLEDP
jgi:hypothetical protein